MRKNETLQERVTLRIDKTDIVKARKLAKLDNRRLTDWLRLAVQEKNARAETEKK